MGQKGKTVEYARVYLAEEEEKEEQGGRRGRGDRRERRRERKLILGARDALKTQRFRLGFLSLFVFPSPRRVRLLKKKGTTRVRHGHGRQIAE